MQVPGRNSRGFTLVELLVVIAIIGVLVALLLPAVQAAREAARMAECRNKLKQVGLSIANFESAKRVLPTGGGHWRPQIENYVEGGKPLGPAKQGLGWGFQILPYLEGGAIYNITTQAQLQSTAVPAYMCPSRRPATVTTDPGSPLLSVVLSDYGAAMPCGFASYTSQTRRAPITQATDSAVNRRIYLFGGQPSDPYVIKIPNDMVYLGAITRSQYYSTCNRGVCTRTKAQNVSELVEMQHIEDGTSNTMLVGEKFVRPDLYPGGSGSDDRGWSDGWDPDTMRSTCFQPLQDSLSGVATNDALYGQGADVLNFGSAHPAGFNCVFVDASVHTLRYDIDPLVFDNLGDRRDGETIDMSAL
jgi:prepilin-type N-terminal cleavage/methylation domain-containing protein